MTSFWIDNWPTLKFLHTDILENDRKKFKIAQIKKDIKKGLRAKRQNKKWQKMTEETNKMCLEIQNDTKTS